MLVEGVLALLSNQNTWDSSYNELLDRLHLPTLAQRRLHLSLCFIYVQDYPRVTVFSS